MGNEVLLIGVYLAKPDAGGQRETNHVPASQNGARAEHMVKCGVKPGPLEQLLRKEPLG